MSEMSTDDALPPEDVVPSPVVPKPGAQLRAERERQGLAVADVAQRLKYAPRQIEAVESDDYAALPGLTFVRGFVRGYAKLLGVDAAPLVALLERNAGQDGGPTTVQLQSVSPVRAQFPAPGARHASAWPWIVAIILVVAGIGGYSVYHWEVPGALMSTAPQAVIPSAPPPGAAAGPAAGAPSSDPAHPADGPAASSVQGMGERPPGDVSSTVVPAPATMPEAGPAGVPPASIPSAQGAPTGGNTTTGTISQGRIRLVFRGESWTEIKEAGGRIVYSRKGTAGTEQWADGQPPFDLVVGNAPETRLYYRGNEVDLTPYIKGTVARLQLQ